jgi:hypothetical protein
MSSAIGNKAPVKKLYIEQGTDWYHDFTINNPDGTPMDLTGKTLRGQMRSKALANTIAATFVFTVNNPTTGSGRVSLSNSVTNVLQAGEKITDQQSQYEYDFEWVDDATDLVTRWLQGSAIVYRGVTR